MTVLPAEGVWGGWCCGEGGSVRVGRRDSHVRRSRMFSQSLVVASGPRSIDERWAARPIKQGYYSSVRLHSEYFSDMAVSSVFASVIHFKISAWLTMLHALRGLFQVGREGRDL